MNKGSKAGSKVKTMVFRSDTASKRATIGLDLGDRYSHFCAIDDEGAEVIAEGRVPTTPGAVRRYFGSLALSRIAMECGTHSS